MKHAQPGPHAMSRRAALALVLTGAGAAAIAACTPAPQAAPPPAASEAPTTDQPRPGGTLRMGLPAEPANVDGHTRTPGAAESVWLAFDRLTQYDESLKPLPALAESWDLSSDYRTIKLNLRRGVTWHSGREFTSEDVRWNFLRVRDPKVAASTLGSYSAWFTSIDVPDKYTLVLGSEQPRPTLFDAFELFNMLDPQVMEGPDAKSKAPGTGPFILDEWAQGDHMTFVKNKNYWRSGTPYFDAITARIFRGEQPALAQLEAGAIDAMRVDSPRDVVRLKADPRYTAWEHPNPGTFFELAFNVTVPPFDNKSVRQAFNYAFDRKRFAEQVYLGTAVPSALPWSASSPGYDAQKARAYAFDLDKARSLLRSANVTSLELDVIGIANGYPLVETFMQAYQADLATLNIKLNIKTMEAAQWLDQANNARYNGMYYSGDNNAHVNPATLWAGSPGWRPLPKNNSGWDNQRWKDYVAALSVETDPARQKSLIAEINDYVLDETWVFPIASQPSILMSTSRLRGIVPTLHTGFYYESAWLTA
ncbi:MAG TPA: ABC transporter substrate-binding protein [Chloroflexota bacterium]